jgi:hypothetical protein
MPDFVLGIQTSVTKDTVVSSFLKAEKVVNKFGKTADSSFNQANRAQKKFTGDFTRSLDRIERRSLKTGGIIRGVLGADLIRAGFRRATLEARSFITEAARVESAVVGFQTLTKSMILGAKVVKDLRALGPVTPFEFKDLAPITEMMLAMGSVTAQTLIPTLRMLGDTARGSADKLQRIAFAFSEVISNTKATFQEVRQFTNAGVPLLREVIKIWRRQGESIEEVRLRARKMIRAGKLTATVMRKAFKIMTSEGGTFFRGMERSSKTFEGRMSTMREEIDITRATIGAALLPVVRNYLELAIKTAKTTTIWAKANKDVIKTKFLEWTGKLESIAKDLWPAIKLTAKFMGKVFDAVELLAPILPILAAGWLLNKIALSGLLALEAAKDILIITRAVWAAATAQAAWDAAILVIPGSIALMVTAVIAGLTLITAGIFLAVKHWDFLVEKALGALNFIMIGATKFAFGLLRILVWPFQGILRGIGFFGEKIGELLGIKVLKKEFGALGDIMDELDLRLKEAAGQLPTPARIAENFVQATRTKFGGIIPVQMEPQFVGTGAIDFFKLGGSFKTGVADTKPVSEKLDKLLTKKPGLESFIFNNISKTDFIKQFTGNFPTLEQERQKAAARAEIETPFTLSPGTIENFSEQKQIIEHLVKIDFPNAPKGAKVSFQPGAEAPPVQINFLD